MHLDFDPDFPVTTGTEFPLSEPAEARAPASARNQTGNGIIVWDGYSSEPKFHRPIHARRITPAGQPVGGLLRIDTVDRTSLGFPSVAVAPDGSFAVAWANYVRFFDPNGSPLTGEMEFVPASQYPGPTSIAASPDGQYVVVWETTRNGDPSGGVFARRYSSTGSAIGAEIHVNDIVDRYQGDADVAYLPNGDWVVAWMSDLNTGTSYDIRAKAFHGATPVTAEFSVNTQLAGLQEAPAIATSSDGFGYVVVWGSGTAQGRRFSEEHQPIAEQFQAASSASGGLDVAYGSQGRFLVACVGNDGDGSGIAVQQLFGNGTKLGPEVVVNQLTASTQDTPTVAGNYGEKFLLAWRSYALSYWNIEGLEYTYQDFQEPEITVLDDAGASEDLVVDFGRLAPHDPIATHMVTVRNDGNVALVVSGLSVTGSGAARFAVDDLSDFVLAAGESKVLTVSFDPAELGMASSVLTFDHNDTSDVASGDVDPRPISVGMAALVVAPPSLDLIVLPGTILETAGEGAATVLVTRRNVDAAGLAQALTVSLASSDEGEATLDGMAVIPADELSVLVAIDAVDDFDKDGTQTVNISASAAGFVSDQAVLLVQSANHPPTLAPLSDATVTVGQAVSFTAIATDPDLPADALTFSLGPNAPTGAAIDPLSGQFLWIPTAGQATGPYAITVQVADDGSPIERATETFAVTVIPAAPLIGGVTTDAGSSSGDGITNDTTLEIYGTAQAGGQVEVFLDGTSLDMALAGVDGNWRLNRTAYPLAQGIYSLTATVSDSLGNESPVSQPFALMIDNTNPHGSLGVTTPTNDATPLITVTPTDDGSGIVADGTIYLDVDLNNDGDYADAGELGYTAQTLAAGTVTFELSPALGEGTYGLRARFADRAGNDGSVEEAPLVVDLSAPATATVAAADVGPAAAGQTTYQFTIGFTDNLALDAATLDGGDVTVTGPANFSQSVSFVSVDPAGNGTPRTVTYQITPPGGSWDAADIGTYTIVLHGGQVFDVAGNAVPANASLDSFTVNVTAAQPRAAAQLVAVASPSATGADALPSSLDAVTLASDYYVEVWVQELVAPGVGISGGRVDVLYTTAIVDALSVVNQDYAFVPSGTIDDPNGLVNDLGGGTLDGGLGVTPRWARLGYVKMQATALGEATFQLSPGALQFSRYSGGNVDWSDVDLGSPIVVDQIGGTQIDMTIVETPTATAGNGEVAALPASEAWVHEWMPFWVEIWASTPDTTTPGVAGATVGLDYNTAYLTPTEIQYGPAFTQNRTGTIDDALGSVTAVGGATALTDVGDDAYVLLARVRLASTGSDQVPVDEAGRHIGPYDMQLALADGQAQLVGGGTAIPDLAPPPATELWAVMYDIDGNNLIDFGDLSFFAPAFGLTVGEPSPEPPYAWWADFDKSGLVDFGDLSFFAPNFGSGRASGQTIVFPPNFPTGWAGAGGTNQGRTLGGGAPLEASDGAVPVGLATLDEAPASLPPDDHGSTGEIASLAGESTSGPAAVPGRQIGTLPSRPEMAVGSVARTDPRSGRVGQIGTALVAGRAESGQGVSGLRWAADRVFAEIGRESVAHGRRPRVPVSIGIGADPDAPAARAAELWEPLELEDVLPLLAGGSVDD